MLHHLTHSAVVRLCCCELWCCGHCMQGHMLTVWACPNCCRPASAAAASPFVRMLAEAEVSAGTAEGAAQLWGDSPRLTAVLEMLKRPASGSAYKQWASSAELRKAAKVGWPALPCTVSDQQKLLHRKHCTAAARTRMAELSARRSCCSTMCSCAGVRPPHLGLQAAIPPSQLVVTDLLLRRWPAFCCRGRMGAGSRRQLSCGQWLQPRRQPWLWIQRPQLSLQKLCARQRLLPQVSCRVIQPFQIIQGSTQAAELSCRTVARAWRLTHISGPMPAAKQCCSHAFNVHSACVFCRRAECRW